MGCPKNSSIRDKISFPWVQEFPSNKSIKEGYPLKRRHFGVISSNNVKMVADMLLIITSINDGLFRFIISTSMTERP